MAKTVIKELIIVLLLCLAIILILGILMYEYVPITKTIPNQVSYTTPQDAKEELQAASEISEDQIVMTYEVNSSDLNNYKRTQDYKPGKANPFEEISSEPAENTNNNSGNSSTNNQENSDNNTTTNNGNYYPDKGIK